MEKSKNDKTTSSVQDVNEAARLVRAGESAKLNPTGKGGFAEHPENINRQQKSGEAAITYWLNKLGPLSIEEVDEKAKNPKSYFQKIAIIRLQRAARDNGESLPESKEIEDRVSGKARQSVENIHEIKTPPVALVEYRKPKRIKNENDS